MIGFVILFGMVSHVLRPEGQFAHIWADLFWTVASCATGIRALIAARRSQGLYRKGWYFISGACFSWFLGMLIWDWFELVVKWATPFPTWSDFGFMLFAPLMAFGLYCRRPFAFSLRSFTLLQFGKLGILAICLVVVHLLVFAYPLDSINESWLYKYSALGYPVLYMTSLLFSMSLFWRWQHPFKEPVTTYLVVGLAIHAVTDSIYAYTLLGHEYQAGNYMDILWIFGFSAIYYAAAHPSVGHEHTIKFEEDNRISVVKMDFLFPIVGLFTLGVVGFFLPDSFSLLSHNVLFILLVLLLGFIGLREWASNRFEQDLTREQLASEAKYHSIFNAANDAILILDPFSGVIVEANHRFSDIFGFDINEIHDKKIGFANLGWYPLPDNKVEQWLKSAFYKGAQEFEWSAKGNGDHLFWCAVHLSKVTLVDGVRLIAVIRDISAAKKAESFKEKSHRQYEALTTRIPVGVYVFRIKKDGSMGFDYVSSRFCEMLNIQRSRLMKDSSIAFSLVHPDDQDAFIRLNNEVSKSLKDFIWEGRFVIKGSERWIRLESVPTLEQNGDSVWNGVVIDVTDRCLAEKAMHQAHHEAEKANKVKGDFLAAMSHEIRTPMNVALGMADILMGTPLNEEQKGYLNKLQAAGDSLVFLINQILDLSKMESGKMQLVEEPVNIQALISEVAEMFRLIAVDKGIVLENTFDTKMPVWLRLDGDRLRQIFFNLLGNAIKFTKKGRIKVQCIPNVESKKVFIEIQDTGIGIHEDALDEIFEIFRQGDSTVTRRYGGTGLGLTLSRQLVELMGGLIQVESHLGQGSCFSVELPMVVCDVPDTVIIPAKSLNDSTDELSGKVRKRKVLLVEDAEDNQMLIKVFLRKAPYQLTICNNGSEAVSHVKKEAFDIILMDVQMPIMDGYTATRHIRSWEVENNLSHTKIIALTAHAMREDKQRSLDAGCDMHLTKPIKKMVLLEVLAQV
ncbi:MAG: response regulator [Magnetococcales bacterium]|nr:response regulator [Magnetococcales bacterium]